MNQNHLQSNFLALISNFQKPQNKIKDYEGNSGGESSRQSKIVDIREGKKQKEREKRNYGGNYQKTDEDNSLRRGRKRRAQENVECTSENKKTKMIHTNKPESEKIYIDELDRKKEGTYKDDVKHFQCSSDEERSADSCNSDEESSAVSCNSDEESSADSCNSDEESSADSCNSDEESSPDSCNSDEESSPDSCNSDEERSPDSCNGNEESSADSCNSDEENKNNTKEIKQPSVNRPNHNTNIEDGKNYKIYSNIHTTKRNEKIYIKRLEDLLNSDTSFAVASLANPRSGFLEVLQNRPLSPDLLMLIIKLLHKINGSNAYQLKMQVYSSTFQPDFIDELKKFVSVICIEDNRERLEAMSTFFFEVLDVLSTVVNTFPSAINLKLKSILNVLLLSMRTVRDEHDIYVSDGLFSDYKELVDQVHSHMEHNIKVDREQKLPSKAETLPPDSYRKLQLIPTKEDFLTDKAFLRQNIVKGSYNSVDHYLDVQFRLLREDFISPLREGIFEYIGSLSSLHLKRKYTNVRLYHNVRFESSHQSKIVHGVYIHFDKKICRHFNWEYSKRFMPGSLLLISDNDFQTFFLATVKGRNIKQLERGLLFVTFIPGTDVPENLFDDGVCFVMAESEIYYEAYRHVLSALQRMNEKNFPMKKYIIDVDTAPSPPAYLKEDSVYMISSYNIKLLDDCSWPSPEQLKLNPSQHQALKSALTNEFSVIQGPPGTGKTFLALKITEILLTNGISCSTPIVVICYTNHALDQFLEGILKYTPHVIRIGMQSKNESLQKFNLEEIRKKSRNRDCSTSYHFRKARRQKFNTQERLHLVKRRIEELSSPEGILDMSVLKSVVASEKYDDLKGFEFFWLFCSDNPELLTVEDKSEDLTEMPSEDPAKPDLAKGDSENVCNNEEDMDEETSRRLAEVIEEEDFFETINDNGRLKYRIESERLEENIKQLYKNCAESFHLACSSKEARIEELKEQLCFLKEHLNRFKHFKFNPDKFKMFEETHVWGLNVNDRWEYYFSWVHLYICQLNQSVHHLTKVYQDIEMELDELWQLEDWKFVKDAAIVGMTTSGAAKRRVLLESLCTKIVIVEEAAEVLEAHIVTSLVKNVQHVILIGDHKQLKPKPAVFKLAKKYNLDCSLFERMINNGLGCSVLNEQHRMRPEIASLVSPTIYPDLANHPSTLDRLKIRGIDRFVYFLTHNHPEDQLPDSSSKQNKHEADLLMELCKYLLLNEYKPEEITILATYTGQVWYMKKKRREMGLSCPEMRAVRITPVDNFQGEENRIILLSLVRSNKDNKIGFLSTENRVCVALSRAKEGLYMVGNMDNLTNSSSIWPRIKKQLEALNAVGPRLILRCERHPDQLTLISKPDDFQAVPRGGCTQKCGALLDCGHTCPDVCHIIGRDHASYKCQERCNRRLCKVEEHKSVCALKCWEDCNPCNIRVEKQLSCGHTAHLRCYVDPAGQKCIVEVSVPHPACGHAISKACSRNVEDCNCTKPCDSRLPCGHACKKKCHVEDDPDHLKYKCSKPCARDTGCPRRLHACPRRCFEECQPCEVPVKTILPCGHGWQIHCSDDPAKTLCSRPCKKVMTCGHKCKLPCWVPCNPGLCTEMVNKQAPCGHLKTVKCNSSPEGRKCQAPCLRLLACGHLCPEKCFVNCTKVQCKEQVDSLVSPACGHPALKIPCHLNKPELQSGSDELLQLCGHPCSQLMQCGHPCGGSCGACMQGRLHVPCNQLCARTLVCGHRCTSKCGMFCPPCYKRCVIKCNHGKCYGRTRNNHPCFKHCESPCDKPCMWKCPHYQCRRRCGEDCDRPPCYEPCREVLGCGHPCVGYCGEPCPPLCAICNIDDPAIRSNPFARYVLLEDCKHVIEGSLFDTLVTSATRNNTFRLMRCPFPICSEPIVNTERCKTVYLRFRKQVVNINKIVSEDEIDRLLKMHSRHAELLASEPSISGSMNSLMSFCSEPFIVLPNTQLKGSEMGRLIVGCLLHPLAVRCKHLKTEEEQRLRQRLKYLTRILVSRLEMEHFGYQTMQQLELMVAQILRLTTNKATHLSWYEVTPYTWEADRALAVVQLPPLPLDLPAVAAERLSSTLRTRDGAKQWFLCDKQHLYVGENGEACITCRDEAEENQRRMEEERRRVEQRKRDHSDRRGSDPGGRGMILVSNFGREGREPRWGRSERGRGNRQWGRDRSPWGRARR